MSCKCKCYLKALEVARKIASQSYTTDTIRDRLEQEIARTKEGK